MGYSPAAIFAAETISTCIAIYLGESIIANELLTGTKGRSMGWGFVAFGFGMAFGVGKMVIGYISATMNPAAALAKLIVGELTGIQFVAAICGEFLGAFLGAVLVWLHFLPHFKTVPEPLPQDDTDFLLRTRDALTPSALGIASYNTRESDVEARKRGVRGLKAVLHDIQHYLQSDSHIIHEPVEGHAELIQVALGNDQVKGVTHAKENYLRRRSAQVCDVHRRLKDVDMEDFKAMLMKPEVSRGISTRYTMNGLGGVEGLRHAHTVGEDTLNSALSDIQNHSSIIRDDDSRRRDTSATTTTISDKQQQQRDEVKTNEQEPLVIKRKQEKLDKLYDSAIIADQNAKLSIFATRPAIFTPFFNFLCEFLCTTTLIYAAFMFMQQKEQVPPNLQQFFVVMEGLNIGFLIFVLVLGLGGPTGIAANPARDFSPRLAHFVLPIPGKGPSEFYYSWIPFVASFAGGCAAAGLYLATQLMNQSNYVE